VLATVVRRFGTSKLTGRMAALSLCICVRGAAGDRWKSLWQRIADATVFWTFAAHVNFDYRQRIPNGMFTHCMESCSGVSLSRPDRKRVLMYIKRAMYLLVHCAVCKPSRHLQSRPVKASLVREILYEWFSGMKHSVTTRIPPRWFCRTVSSLQSKS
jgi:hypothetical protein